MKLKAVIITIILFWGCSRRGSEGDTDTIPKDTDIDTVTGSDIISINDQIAHWHDESSRLTWTDPTHPESIYADVEALCAAINKMEPKGWRLPTIDEFRTLLRGCKNTEANGICGVTSECTKLSCCDEKNGGGCGGEEDDEPISVAAIEKSIILHWSVLNNNLVSVLGVI